jgi:hypothetical protein
MTIVLLSKLKWSEVGKFPTHKNNANFQRILYGPQSMCRNRNRTLI